MAGAQVTAAGTTSMEFLPFPYGAGWSAEMLEKLQSVASGAHTSGVNQSRHLVATMEEMRTLLGLPDLKFHTKRYLTLFFDGLVPREYAADFFESTLPRMASLALRLPELVKQQAETAAELKELDGRKLLPLQVMKCQQPGTVLLSQETVASLLACAFFCLLPSPCEGSPLPRTNNFDAVFSNIRARNSNEAKMLCLVNYFRRVAIEMPAGNVSFERKVLAMPAVASRVDDFPRPKAAACSGSPLPSAFSFEYWRTCTTPLCPFEVKEGTIEDDGIGFIQVDFANRYLGGGALRLGAVQEEIRFMINPELVCGMIFMEVMQENESIEMTGAEQFSTYKGYARTFQFAGDFVDTMARDGAGRRRTKIVAIDGIRRAGRQQLNPRMLLREVNKAFCGFAEPHIAQRLTASCQSDGAAGPVSIEASSVYSSSSSTGSRDEKGETVATSSRAGESSSCEHAGINVDSRPSSSAGEREMSVGDEGEWHEKRERKKSWDSVRCRGNEGGNGEYCGLATGNWGCGAYGGDPQLKSMLQWISASEARQQQVLYFPFGDRRAEGLKEAVEMVTRKGWTAGDLFGRLEEYGRDRLSRKTEDSLFTWIHRAAA